MADKDKNSEALALPKDEIAVEQALAAVMDANDAKLPKLEVNEDGSVHAHVVHVGTYSKMFGNTQSSEFAKAMLGACVNVSGSGEALEGDKSQALAIVAEIAPQDGIEAMLATQMAAVHITAMRESRRRVPRSQMPI